MLHKKKKSIKTQTLGLSAQSPWHLCGENRNPRRGVGGCNRVAPACHFSAELAIVTMCM